MSFPISVLRSQQAVQDDKYSPEDYDVFNSAGRSCIEEGHSAQVLSILVDEKNQVCVCVCVCDSSLPFVLTSDFHLVILYSGIVLIVSRFG